MSDWRDLRDCHCCGAGWVLRPAGTWGYEATLVHELDCRIAGYDVTYLRAQQ